MYEIIEETWSNGMKTYAIAFQVHGEWKVEKLNNEYLRFSTLKEANQAYLKIVEYPYGTVKYIRTID